MFCVVNRRIGISGSEQTMGRGVLPLDTVNPNANPKKFSFSFRVDPHYAHSHMTCTFLQVPLQYHSMPAGHHEYHARLDLSVH